MLECKSVYVKAGKQFSLKGLSFEIKPGRLLAILGPNGAGKSTLLKALSGVVPYEGSIKLEGHSLSSISMPALSTKRAVLSQTTTLSFPFTTQETIYLGMMMADVPETKKTEIAEGLIKQLDLHALRLRPFHVLSGGEKQRTHFARVLAQLMVFRRANNRQLLFLDEPTSSLDLKHQLTILTLAREFAQAGNAVIAVLHDINLATRFADDVVLLERGEMRANGKPADAFHLELLMDVYQVRLSMFTTEFGDFYYPTGAF